MNVHCHSVRIAFGVRHSPDNEPLGFQSEFLDDRILISDPSQKIDSASERIMKIAGSTERDLQGKSADEKIVIICLGISSGVNNAEQKIIRSQSALIAKRKAMNIDSSGGKLSADLDGSCFEPSGEDAAFAIHRKIAGVIVYQIIGDHHYISDALDSTEFTCLAIKRNYQSEIQFSGRPVIGCNFEGLIADIIIHSAVAIQIISPKTGAAENAGIIAMQRANACIRALARRHAWNAEAQCEKYDIFSEICHISVSVGRDHVRRKFQLLRPGTKA